MYKCQKLSLKDIFQDAVKEKRKGVEIKYIWETTCEYCGCRVRELDEEYSFEYKSQNENVTFEELLEAFKKSVMCEVLEDIYEEELELFFFIDFDEGDRVALYYYYVEAPSDYYGCCQVCEEVFKS